MEGGQSGVSGDHNGAGAGGEKEGGGRGGGAEERLVGLCGLRERRRGCVGWYGDGDEGVVLVEGLQYNCDWVAMGEDKDATKWS